MIMLLLFNEKWGKKGFVQKNTRNQNALGMYSFSALLQLREPMCALVSEKNRWFRLTC